MSHATQDVVPPLYTIAAEENPRGMEPGTYYYVRRRDGERVSMYTHHAAIAASDMESLRRNRIVRCP